MTILRLTQQQIKTEDLVYSSDITELDLSRATLGIDSQNLIRFLKTIPGHITSLNLSDNALSLRSDEELKEIISALPSSLKILNLEGNTLNFDRTLETIFKQIKENLPSISSVLFNGNVFFETDNTPKILSTFFASLPPNTDDTQTIRIENSILE